MKEYNAVGLAIMVVTMAAAAFFAPESMGPVNGMLVGALYFVFIWLIAGLYLSDVLHLALAHGALDFKKWFLNAVVLINNTIGIYLGPVSWVNRHRNHHKFSDHQGDPNKRSDDGFWKTTYLCLFPYRCEQDMARDQILKSWVFVLTEHSAFTVLSQFTSYAFIWIFVRDWKYALVLWLGIRVFALWVNLIQNYWTHDRRFGTRRYDDAEDNAMNIGEWFPVMATFSACWQNNHHHYPNLLRLSHDPKEFDFGYLTIKAMAALGLVKASRTGAAKPADLAHLEVSL